MGDIPLKKFWADMDAGADIYSVGEPTPAMKETTYLPAQLTCGGFTDRLSAATSWLSSGGMQKAFDRRKYRRCTVQPRFLVGPTKPKQGDGHCLC